MEPLQTPGLQKIPIPKKIFGYDITFVDSFINRAKKEIECLKDEIKKEQEKTLPLEQLIQKKEVEFKEELEQKTAKLELLKAELEKHQAQHQDLGAENQLITDLKEKLAEYEKQESYVKEAIITAQKMAKELKQKTEQDADKLLYESRCRAEEIEQRATEHAHHIQTQAQSKAHQIIENAQHELNQIKWSIENLQIQKNQQVDVWRKMLEEQLELLENDNRNHHEIYPQIGIIERIAG